MKCPMCDGTGKSEIGVGAFTIHGADCDRCNGKGVIEPMTNEEYLRSLNTEQLADVFFDYRYINATPQQQLWLSANEDFVKGGIVEWLKQPHKDGESCGT